MFKNEKIEKIVKYKHKVRVKKSPLKIVENLKFIPVNLHLEQFLVETNQTQLFDNSNLKEKACYDFISVGAFTTVHTCKSNVDNHLESVMRHEKHFEFENRKHDCIDNEILLIFYSLKILTELGSQLIDLNEHTFHKKSERVTKEIEMLKNRLEILYRVLCDSFKLVINKSAENVRVDFKQKFFNLKENLEFFRVKFKAFYIEIDNLIICNEYHNLNKLLNEIMIFVVNFFTLIFTECVPEKFTFINNCAIFCQALTTLISSIDLKYNKNYNYSDLQIKNLLEFHQKNGILFQFESMLSCFSSEYSMLYEHYQALQNFHHVFIHLPTNYLSLMNGHSDFFKISVEKDGFHVNMYSPDESKPIRVYPVMVNVGINEASITSNLMGNNFLQKFINNQSVLKLISYYQHTKSDLRDNQNRLERVLYELNSKKSLRDDPRPVELLHKVAEVTRLMNGLRVTNCKSGKDRSGVGVSLEQCLLLLRNHNLENSMIQEVLDDFRRNGTRMDILQKNVGYSKYAFNKIRYFLLPQLYRPPIELCSDLQT